MLGSSDEFFRLKGQDPHTVSFHCSVVKSTKHTGSENDGPLCSMLLLRYAEKELESRHKRAELAISGPQKHANKSCEIVECIYCAANASFCRRHFRI